MKHNLSETHNMVNCDFKMKHTLFQTHVMVEYGNWKTKNSFLKHIWWNQMPAKNSVMMLMENLRNIWWNTISDIEIPIHQMSLFMVLFHHHLNQYILVPPKTSQVTMREPPISKGPTSAPRTTPCCFSTIIGVEGGTEKKNRVSNVEHNWASQVEGGTEEKLSVRHSDMRTSGWVSIPWYQAILIF